jgi:uncharacterized protein YfbU (UPF0304 family)
MGYLDPNQSVGLNRIADNLRRGFEPLYRMVLEPVQPVLPANDSDFVHQILGLYGRLRDNFANLDDKGSVEEHQVAWPGFDGNGEVELLSYTGALSADNHFRDVLDEDPTNSHTTMVPTYERMIAKWHELGKPTKMDLSQITQILEARRHPGA